jgi:uncharacterized surface protein with fasciclin (FAS1) repeats
LTLFAPTDAAFAALPAGTIDALLADPTGLLTQILLYHVVDAQALSTDLSDGQMIATLNGADVTVTINGNGVFINNAQVIVADIIADNGVVHVIDAVLIPAAEPTTTILDIVVNSDVHNTLEAAVVAAGLQGALSGPGPLTLFAPTDAAFAALPAGTIEALLSDPSGALTTILLYHVAGLFILSGDLSDGQTVGTLLNEDLAVTVNAEGIFINNAKIIIQDIVADNGIVHVIDAVLIPSSLNTDDVRTAALDLFPNPANETLVVQTAFSCKGWSVHDIQGRLILQGNNTFGNRMQITVSELEAGVYFIQLEDGTSSISKMFVKH